MAEIRRFVVAPPEGQRAEWLAQVAALVDNGVTPAELPLEVVVGLTTLA